MTFELIGTLGTTRLEYRTKDLASAKSLAHSLQGRREIFAKEGKVKALVMRLTK